MDLLYFSSNLKSCHGSLVIISVLLLLQLNYNVFSEGCFWSQNSLVIFHSQKKKSWNWPNMLVKRRFPPRKKKIGLYSWLKKEIQMFEVKIFFAITAKYFRSENSKRFSIIKLGIVIWVETYSKFGWLQVCFLKL